jgi:hypothetical protein
MDSPLVRRSAGLEHARLRYKQARITMPLALPFTDGDYIRFLTFRSGDRIMAIYGSCDSNATATVVDLGIYKTGANHDGAVVTTDVFVDGDDVNAADLDREDWFTQATDLTGLDRGKTLWELANLSDEAPAYTEDPGELWDLTMECMTTQATAAQTFVIEVEYTSGD